MSAAFPLLVSELEATKIQPIHTKGSIFTIQVADKTGITAGLLTFRFAQAGTNIFETPADNTVDLSQADPESFTIETSAIGAMEITLTGYSGTPTSIIIVVNDRA